MKRSGNHAGGPDPRAARGRRGEARLNAWSERAPWRRGRPRPSPRLPCLLPILLGLLAGCPSSNRSPEAGPAPRAFFAPQGIAATSRHVLVVSSGFHFEEGRPTYGPGWLTVIERRSRRILGRVPLGGINPQQVAVQGERAYVLSSGALHLDAAGLASAAGDGNLELIELAAGVPTAAAARLLLPRSSSDPRIGAYSGLALSADGTRAFLGSASRGDLFVVELGAELRLLRGPDNPLQLFPTPPGQNGLTSPFRIPGGLAVTDFNSDSLCLIADPGGALEQRRCGGVGAYPDLLEGPLDLASLPGGGLLLLMSLASGVYRVDPTAQPFTVEQQGLKTGLAPNRLLVDGEHAYVLNSLSNNLQRLELASGQSQLPFAVFPVGSNPYDFCITQEPEGPRAWVTLQASHQVAVVDLRSGALLELLAGDPGSGELGARPDGARLDAGPPDRRPCPDGGSPLVGIGNVVALELGPGGGAGKDRLPAILQGGPAAAGSTDDMLSLGVGGSIVVDFGDHDIVDGPGPDLIVFENPFLTGPYQPYAEPAVVGLSASSTDASSFLDFPCDLDRTSGSPATQSWPYPGCAGVRPVLAGAGSCLPPTDPALAGGDAFDLASLGLSRARYLRLRDAGPAGLGENTRGFDLDAIVLIHYTKR